MRRILFILTVIAILIAAAPAAAQVPGPGGPYNSAFTIQNLESRDGTCVYTLYDSSGNAAFTSTAVSIQANKSAFVYVGGLSVAAGMYSVVVSCDVEVVAVSNYSGLGGAYAASYSGVSAIQAATTVYLPGIYKNYYGYYTNVAVQNTSGAPINATLRIYQGATLVDSETRTIPAYSSVVLDQRTRASLHDGIYSGVIEATGPVAAIVNVWNGTGQQYAYNGFASGSSVAYAPVLMKSYYGFNTALTVQNIGNTDVTVTVTYSNGATNTKIVAARASQLFYTPNEPGLPNGWIGSAKVEAPGGSIVVLVNESDSNNRAASYVGFAAGGTTSYAPIVLRKYYGYSTSITCQNIGAASTNITVTYSNGAVETRSNVPVNGTALFYQPNTIGLPDGFNGSAVITADQPIVCVINENQVTNPAAQDFLLAYEGVVR